MPELPTVEELARMVADLNHRIPPVTHRTTSIDNTRTVIVPQQGETVYFDERITVAFGNPSANVPRTSLNAGLHVPSDAKELILWAGTLDRTDGTGISLLQYHSGSATLYLCEQKGTTTGDTQNNMGRVTVPYYGGADYSVFLDGATTFPFRIDLVGYKR